MLDDALVIDIGAGTTDLCRMHGTMPEESDQITTTYAGDYVDTQLSAAIAKKYPQAQFTVQMIKEIKEKHSFVNGADHGRPAGERSRPFAFEVRAACCCAADRRVSQADLDLRPGIPGCCAERPAGAAAARSRAWATRSAPTWTSTSAAAT
jgi:hypothetical protein